MEAAAVQKLGTILKTLTEVLSMVGASSEMGKELLPMITKLAKLVPPGSVSPAGEANNIQNMALKNAQNTQMMQMMKQGAGGGGQGAPPPPMPQAA
jgi:hypothetical protein